MRARDDKTMLHQVGAGALEDPRFDVPLYTVAEAARILDVPSSTLSTWGRGYVRRFADRPAVSAGPVITWLDPASDRAPCIPFVGLAEALVVAAVRRSGVPMQRIRPAIDELKRQIGIDHALASKRVYTDGAELLFDYATRSADADTAPLVLELVVVRHGQRVFAEALEQYLVNIDYGPDQYASRIRLPSYTQAEVLADPLRSFGRPILARGGARVSDVLDRFWSGQPLAELSDEFGAPLEQIEDLVRVASRRAA
ncbi:MAG: hypothetical protein OXE79_06250 [Acidimicrobiaceae bacterium]|nr:hypothetical protein [Acidimicrobiaceae bacterium]MCY4281005.1 hypothetical protein [Acidimicrobiaceae bacterium]MCY4294856.1 hypothetical protein [Acidimicrobiaceae bacterium]